ncbi:MAG TPA: lipid-transfer protein [Solirubrobacteraceae bacterium]|nr:lipid-transfer protein [Solirubrobacteraceae bacterium]
MTARTRARCSPGKAFVAGVGMTKFEKPGRREWDYPDMVRESATKALEDAGVSYADVEHVCAGWVYGDSTAGQRAVYELGLTGVPIINVNNNCSTGSSSLYLARALVAGGLADCVLAVGFEKMERGSLKMHFPDRVNPMDKHIEAMYELVPEERSPFAAQLFGNAGREHMRLFGTTREQIAKIAEKNHRHSVDNPFAQFQDEYTLDEILASPMVHDPLTRLQCSPTSDGSAAAIVVGERFLDERNGMAGRAIEIVAQSMVTDLESTFADRSARSIVGAQMTKKAADEVYELAGVGPEDVQVIELHDCFASNELISYEALGLCEEGEAGRLVDEGDVDYGGRWVVNPSGGLISKGHPLGATGLAQCAELTWQLRGEAGARQVHGAEHALQHNIGLGGAAVVSLYRRAA